MNSFINFSQTDRKIAFPFTNLAKFPTASPFSNFKNSSPIETQNLNSFVNFPNSFSPNNSRPRTPSTNSLSPISNYSPLRRSGPAPVNPELNNLLLTWKLQQNIQTELFKAQMQQLMEIKNSLLEKLNQQQVQPESQVKSPNQVSTKLPVEEQRVPNDVKIEASIEEPAKVIPKMAQTSPNRALKVQIRDIINFVLENFGRISESQFEEEKLKYSYDKDLMAVFDLLTSKYSSTIKTKEEMVKYTLRRAFKYIKNNLKKQTNANTKGVCKTLCNKYFHASQDEISKVGNEEEFLKVVLPFRKNSKNKTMNTSFITEVFSSEDFCRDYQSYLDSLDGILEADNKSKIERLAGFIEDCITKKKIMDIKNYKRIPWPRLWITNTKNIAQNLPAMASQSLQSPTSTTKKCRKEMNLNGLRNFEEMEGNECSSEASTNSNSNC